jgi:excisionase family DNA binding protein
MDSSVNEGQRSVRTLVTISEIADLLVVPRKTIATWRHRGKIKPETRVGNVNLFDLEKVRSFIEIRRPKHN